MADRILSEEQIGQRMISMAIGRGLVTPEQVRECEEFAQENLFQGSVILALHYRGYLGSDELKKVIDLCLPDRKGDQPILEFAARTTNRPKKKST